jgi:photosystem II stability/assembly factor-like uncharacterized protein
MKSFIKYLIILSLFTSYSFSQNYNEDFLDGTIMFQIDENNLSFEIVNQPDKNIFSKNENLSDFPQIAAVFNEIEVIKFERPSYYTNKRSLQTIFRIEFTDFDRIDELITELELLSYVKYAEKEPIYKLDFIPNDAQHFGNNKWYHTLVDSEEAWDITLGNSNIKVAIIDNAVANNHSDLTIYKQRDVADSDNDASPPVYYNQSSVWSHGTHCAGLAAADINNGIGIASLGGNAEIIAVKGTPDSADGNFIYNLYAGIQWACENGANIINMSLGSSSQSESTQNLINNYPDIIFIAAAGNDNVSTISYPAGYQNVIGVGSVDDSDLKSSFSNYNAGIFSWVDIASPGGFSFGGLLSSVYSSDGNSYAKKSGTSMASPFAAGLVAQMLTINPSLNHDEVLNCLQSTGVEIDQNIGNRIDADAALECVQASLTGDPIPWFNTSQSNIYEGGSVTFTDNSIGGGNDINNWQWSFEGGNPSSFTGQNPPEIFYSTLGTYDVTLVVSNSQSSQSLLKESHILVSEEPSGEWISQNTFFANATTGVRNISIVDENVVWASGYDGSGDGANYQVYTKTSNGGSSWSSGNINLGDTNLGIAMINAISSTTAWVVGYPTAAGQTGGIWKTTNGGSSWTRQNSASYNSSGSFTNVVHFWDENYGFAQGDPIGGEYELYVTSDGGNNWEAVPGANIPNPGGGEYGYVGQIEVVGDNVWFTTNSTTLYHSTDKGNNWVAYQCPVDDFNGDSMSFSDANNGIIISGTNIYRTYDSGETWTQIDPIGPVYNIGVCYVEGTDTIFSTSQSGSSQSFDGGITWNVIDNETFLGVEFINSTTGWAGSFNGDLAGGIWKWSDFSLSQDEISNESSIFKIYPNPVNDVLSIKSINDINSIIYDITGKKVLESNSKNINLEKLSKGIYIINIRDLINNISESMKIIKN